MPRLCSHLRLGLLSSLGLGAALLASGCSSSSSPASMGPADSGAHEASTRDAAHDGHTGAKHDGAVSDAQNDAAEEAAIVDAGVDVAVDAGGPTDAGKPVPPAGDATPSSTELTFAMHHIWLGDSLPDPAFTADPTGTVWSTFGYNIDGLITNEKSTDVCTLDQAAGATTIIQLDGVNGIDNSFGKNIVSFLVDIQLNDLSEAVSESIEDGTFTVLVDTKGLTNDPAQTNTGLTGQVYGGAAYGNAPPTVSDGGPFLTTDNWPVTSTSVLGSLEAGAVEAFPHAYVTHGTWVNGSPGDVTLQLNLQGQGLTLKIHQAIITFAHTIDDAGQDHATKGMISGVLKKSEFLAEIDEVAAQQDLCSEYGLVLNGMAKTADILSDGTNTAGVPCDGISVGISFDGDAITAPTQVVPVVDAGNQKPPCVADAGG